MNRREFARFLRSASSSYLLLRVTACSPVGSRGHTSGDEPKEVLVYDLLMEGYSGRPFPLGERLGPNGVLKADAIRDFKTVTLPYVQDSDGHKFTLTAEHFAALLKGKSVTVTTTEAGGHVHEVRIDPKRTTGKPLKVYVDQDGKPVDSQSGNAGASDQLFVALDGNEKPQVYVTSSAELDEGSVQICFDAPAECQKNDQLWHGMHRHTPRVDKQIMASNESLGLDAAGGGEVLLSIRGKRKKDGTLLKAVMKLVRI